MINVILKHLLNPCWFKPCLEQKFINVEGWGGGAYMPLVLMINQTSVSGAIEWVIFKQHCIHLKQISTVYKIDKATFSALCKKVNSQQGGW